MRPDIEFIMTEAEDLILKHLGPTWKLVPCHFNMEQIIESEPHMAGRDIHAACNKSQKQIEINADILKRYPLPSMWRKTILHEIAHAKLGGCWRDHNIFFRFWMLWLRQAPTKYVSDHYAGYQYYIRYFEARRNGSVPATITLELLMELDKVHYA